MASKIIQRTKPVTIGVNGTATFDGSGLDGFLPITAGTLTVTTSRGLVIVDSVPVTAGTPLPLPYVFPDGSSGGSVSLAGGASGVLSI